MRRELVSLLYRASTDSGLSKTMRDQCWDLAGRLFDEWRRGQEAEEDDAV